MLNLKVAMVLYGAIHLVQGFFLIIVPDRVVDLSGFGGVAGFEPYFLALLGSTFIAAAVWFIISGLDLLKNIAGVKFAIMWSVILLVVQLYTVANGTVTFGDTWVGIVETAIFAVAFLVFYPYRNTDSS